MNEYSIQLTKHARSDLESLPVRQQKLIGDDVKQLTTNPFPKTTQIKRLKGFAFPLYRLRSGNFRVLYRIDQNQITLMRIIDRKMLDRILSRLK